MSLANPARRRVFLLSPAHCGGKRAGYLFNPKADFPLAQRFRRGDRVTLGEAFSFLSGLYFRGKLAYANHFATAGAGAGSVSVITTNRGLLPPDTPVTVDDLRAFGEVDIDLADARYRAPLDRDLARLSTQDPSDVVLLGSIATTKYLEPLVALFRDRLVFPAQFVGLGDMSRGSILLKATRAGIELPIGAGPEPMKPRLASVSLAALGVVFGDLGTSPLYALHDTFVGSNPVAVTRENVLGILSLFIWSLIIVVSGKYLTLMMRAENRGEGGIFALLALTGVTSPPAPGASEPRRRPRSVSIILLLGVAGAALLYGDGVITPAISVLSAVEGLAVAATGLQQYVVPVTVVVLILLFLVQPLGSARIGGMFGPVLALWLITIGAMGIRGIAQEPAVLEAFNPVHGIRYFTVHGWRGFPVLGAVVLCLTGGEALYADMGHFGRRPIRVAWFGLAFPTLVLSYLGQGSVLLTNPAAAHNPFFHSAPSWSLYPLIILATAATVIASQGLITAVFSLTSQAVKLGLSPRLHIVHTSSEEIGQIYLPALNWTLMIACVIVVIGFQSSTRLAAAFGLAVSGTMAITTLLFVAVARSRWKWGLARVTAIAGVFLVIDFAFLGANVLKIRDGGWIPLVIGSAVFILLATWQRGRTLLRQAEEARSGSAADVDPVLASIRKGSAARVRGTAVYLNAVPEGIPRTLLHNLKHNRVVHERVIFLTVLTEEIPLVPVAERVTVTELAPEFWRVVARYGFREEPSIPDVMAQAAAQDLPFRPDETTYFLGRETILSAADPGMARWRERLFGLMMRNARPVSSYFGLPPNRVVELGAQVEI